MSVLFVFHLLLQRLWVENRTLFFGFFICCHSMLNISKSSFGFRLKLHWQIHATLCNNLTIVQCHSFHNPFDLTFAAELVLITLLIIPKIRFTAWKQDLCTCKFFVIDSRIPRIMFFVCVAAHSGKKLSFALAVKWSVQFLGRIPLVMFLV